MAMIAPASAEARPKSCDARWVSSAPKQRMADIELEAAGGNGAQWHHRLSAGRTSSAPSRRFALYGFPESYAASFAMIAYASAYLKVPLPGGIRLAPC